MLETVRAGSPWEDAILDASYPIWHEGLTRAAYERFFRAQRATPWGASHLHRLALVEDGQVLASVKRYDLQAWLDGRNVAVCGIGALFTMAEQRRRGHAARLLESLLEQAAADGAGLALLFSEIGPDYYRRLGFEVITTADLLLEVQAPPRGGAPATLVRAGEERDLADVAAIGRVRAQGFRFALDRSRDQFRFALARRRLLAGLGAAGAREVHFFIAEEGASAVAYVVITVAGDEWTLEECGDRDPTGARVGAMLQVLIAREPAARRPRIRGWLPPGFCPPQVVLAGAPPSREVMMVRHLGPGEAVRWRGDEMLYWRADVF